MKKYVTTFNDIVLKIEQYATGPGPAFDHYMEVQYDWAWAFDPDTLSKLTLIKTLY